MKTLEKYIRESIFDIDDNIDNPFIEMIENLLFKPKKTMDAFKHIIDIVKDNNVSKESQLKYDGTYYVSFFEQYHTCHIIVIKPAKNRSWIGVSIEASKRGDQIELFDFRSNVTPTKYMFNFNAKDRVYFELPKSLESLFDSIASRCKYRTGNIIRESIFDDEDTHISNLDKIADMAYIKKLLKKDDWNDFEKATDEFEKIIKKDYKKIPRSKVDYGNKYLIFLTGENMWNKYNYVCIYHPYGPKKFQSCMVAAFTRDNQTQEICFRRYYNESKTAISGTSDGQTYKAIYELPKEYEWMIEWMNKEYEDGRYKRVY